MNKIMIAIVASVVLFAVAVTPSFAGDRYGNRSVGERVLRSAAAGALDGLADAISGRREYYRPQSVVVYRERRQRPRPVVIYRERRQRPRPVVIYRERRQRPRPVIIYRQRYQPAIIRYNVPIIPTGRTGRKIIETHSPSSDPQASVFFNGQEQKSPVTTKKMHFSTPTSRYWDEGKKQWTGSPPKNSSRAELLQEREKLLQEIRQLKSQ